MSNHLHNLLESIDDAPIFMDYITDAQDVYITNRVKEAAKQCVCFDAGDIEHLQNYKVIEELVRLPYPVVWIEVKLKHKDINMIGGYLMWNNYENIQFYCFLKKHGGWRYLFGGQRLHDVEKGRYQIAHSKPGANTQQLVDIMYQPFSFICAMNCTNVKRKEHTPEHKLQKARAKRGKQPLFSYWTLEIDLPKHGADGECYGGTHAAPRLHLRRGHPRQYAPGKYCWVQPCVVGNKKAGIVHKDYAASYAAPLVPNS